MPRKKDPNKPKKGFMDGYRTYDTSKGFGNANEWRAAFNERMGVEQAKEFLGSKDPLGILGLNVGATWDEVEKAYKKMARLHHPDRNIGNPEAADMMKQINAAYEILENQYGKR